MKMAGLCLIFVSSVLLGIFSARELARRSRQLAGLKKALQFLEREVDYQVTALSDAFLHTADKTEEPWKTFFLNLGMRLGMGEQNRLSLETVVKEEIDGLKKQHPWKKDLEILSDFGERVGELDKQMQILGIRGILYEVEEEQKQALEEERQKGKLYQTMGISMGLLLVIFLL